MSDRQGGPPLLVTGMPRTATSWVGKMLEASGALVYVNEPMNPQHPPGRSPGVLRAEVTHAFQYICEDNERDWLPAFRDTVRLRFHPLAELRRNHRLYDLARFAPDLEAALAADGDGVGRASLLWRLIHRTVAAYRQEIDGLDVVRHEDLSADQVRPSPTCTTGSGCLRTRAAVGAVPDGRAVGAVRTAAP